MARRDRFKIQATPAADRSIRELRGTAAKRYAQLENELRAQGCAAAGYRLLAPDRGDFPSTAASISAAAGASSRRSRRASRG
jgi:hypothetical protein